MNSTTRYTITALALFLSVLTFVLIATAITMIAAERGRIMGNEAHSYYLASVYLAALFGIPAVILWVVIYRGRNDKT